MSSVRYEIDGPVAVVTIDRPAVRNAVAMGLRDLDAALIKSPIVGPIYELFFRKETYYRHDTRLMYLEIVSRVVKRLAEDAVAAKGIKLTRQYEQAPILGELYKPVKPESEPPVDYAISA